MKNIIKLRNVASKNVWNELIFDVNNKVFTKVLFENKINQFWISLGTWSGSFLVDWFPPLAMYLAASSYVAPSLVFHLDCNALNLHNSCCGPLDER